MDQTPNLRLPYLAAAQAQKHVTHNEAIRALDALVQVAVIDRGLATPPASPTNGDRYIVANGPTGTWAGHADHIAAYQDGAWAFHTPREGWLVWANDEDVLCVFDGTAWRATGGAGASVNPTPLVGVNTTADATNRLSVASPATLLSHAGQGHQLKINKAAATDAASLLFQTGFGGRAEIGTIGSDTFGIKVSADGTTWREAVTIEADSADVAIGGLIVSREIMQNALPDSGRFNGNASNGEFLISTFVAPSYLAASSAATFAAHAKFVHDNSDYGGTGGALDPEVRALIDKVRPAYARRYGAEWWVMAIQMPASGNLTEPIPHAGADYGLAFTSAFSPLPAKFTVGYYVRVLTGTAMLNFGDPSVVRGYKDGVRQSNVNQAVAAADGWLHVTAQCRPNVYGYDYAAFKLRLPFGARALVALPTFVFGHAELDPNVGVMMSAKMFG